MIEQLITKGITGLQKSGVWSNFNIPIITVERPKDISHGDWTTSISFVLAKELKKSPFIIAEELAEELTKNNTKNVSEIVAIKPGYINLTLDRDVSVKELQKIIDDKDKYGANNKLSGQKISIEYTQPNPFKPFHIGHLMSNTIGESLSCIIEFSGANVERANYQGDVGPHVAKAIWGLQKLGYEPTDIDKIGKAYAYGHAAAESDENVKKEINALNAVIYNESDEDVMKIYNIGRTETLEQFEKIYKILGTSFDQYYFESETWRDGEKIVREHVGDIFKESDGAIIFEGEKYGLHTRVFITTQGLPTYEAKEVGLVFAKEKRSPADLYIMTTAVEQEEYFKVVKKVIELIDEQFIGKLQHIAHGMMQLSTGKMSSRSGNVITGESLIKDAQKVAMEKMSERAQENVMQDTIDDIAVAGIKFSILKQRAGKNIAYDVDTALSFNGDSGPYLQYTYARCKSVMQKAEENEIKSSFEKKCDNSIDIEKLLGRFPEVVEYSCEEYAPHHIANYLLELAHEYNSYYAKNIIVNVEDVNLSAYRLLVTIAVSHVIKNGMALLGIRVPEQM